MKNWKKELRKYFIFDKGTTECLEKFIQHLLDEAIKEKLIQLFPNKDGSYKCWYGENEIFCADENNFIIKK